MSTGNLNEKTATVYADHCLLTSNQQIMADVNRIFNYLEQPKDRHAFPESTAKRLSPARLCPQRNDEADQ